MQLKVCGTLDGIMSNDFTSKDGKSHKVRMCSILENDKVNEKVFFTLSNLVGIDVC
jgi:hypothetical protein